jgi:hypothetical protein
MKKWSILSSLVVIAALAVAAFATTGAASAGSPYEPYCPAGEEGTPPNCHKHEEGGGGGGGGGGNTGGGGTTNPPPTCKTGEVGTYPNCVVPTVGVGGIKLQPNSTTLTLKINAPGTVKLSGKGVKGKLVNVKPGNVKIKVQLTSKEKKLLKKEGKVSLKVKITYTPTGGTPITKTIKVTVKAPPAKKGHHK